MKVDAEGCLLVERCPDGQCTWEHYGGSGVCRYVQRDEEGRPREYLECSKCHAKSLGDVVHGFDDEVRIDRAAQKKVLGDGMDSRGRMRDEDLARAMTRSIGWNTPADDPDAVEEFWQDLGRP